MPRTVPTSTPVLSPTTRIVTAPVTRNIRINTLAQLPEETKENDKNVVAKYVDRGLKGVSFLCDWASHRLTLRVSSTTPMLSETDDNLFAVFKTIVDEFSPEEETLNETYPETGKHFFYRNEI
jgi:hypothetical protein